MQPDGQSQRFVLVVEDDDAVSRVIMRALRWDNYEARCVGDGMAALAALDDHVPDLILLDVGLPLLGGLEVCRIVRAREDTRRTPILLITGTDTPQSRAEGKAAGADAFLAKPFGPEVLSARMEIALRLRKNGSH